MKIILSILYCLISASGFAQNKPDTLTVKKCDWNKLSSGTYGAIGDWKDKDAIINLNNVILDKRKDSVMWALIQFMFRPYNDSLHLVRLLDENGKVSRIFCDTGEGLIGSYKEYFSNGKLRISGHYGLNRKKTGAWYFFSRDGYHRTVIEYSNGKRIHKENTTVIYDPSF
jgi:antitoxin component YwqK of YwqJK toxin-antitoxin module